VQTCSKGSGKPVDKPDLAINGGPKVRQQLLPYARQWLEEEDLAAVLAVLRGDWLTTGPKIAEFERACAAFVGAPEAVAVSSGTAALHTAMHAAKIGPGDEVIVPVMTFVASANAAVFQGATPVFIDVHPDTLLLDVSQLQQKITSRTRAVVAVDYAGQPCDYDTLAAICRKHNLTLIADGCHALGAAYRERPVGALADLTVFSFHPAKHITTGEGGLVVTADAQAAARMRQFRNHGITTDLAQRAKQGTWHYDMAELGYNYRLTDFQCALGLCQLQRMPGWIARRQEIARAYDAAFLKSTVIRPLVTLPESFHAYHLYVIRLELAQIGASRDEIFQALRAEGIGVNVHYQPVHLHSFYRRRYGTGPGMFPVAEDNFERLLTLPMFPRLTDRDVQDVIAALDKVVG
jgi:perosamine synthetase